MTTRRRGAPAPGKHNISQTRVDLDHLNAAARAYLPTLDEGIADALRRSAHADGPFRHSWAGPLLLRVAEPPSRIRLRSPRVFQPAPGGSREDVVSTLRDYQVEYIKRLRRANGLDLSRAHERRHVCQARRIVATPRFPR